MDCDILVLGAGIVGVSTALHLQARGRDVCLVDRAEPGSGTSHGNAGLIERSSVIPYAFPRDLGALLRYGLNNVNVLIVRLLRHQRELLPDLVVSQLKRS